MEEQKKKGKSEEQIIKDATGKAGIFVMLMILLIVVLVFTIVFVGTGADLTKISTELQRLLGMIYPRFK